MKQYIDIRTGRKWTIREDLPCKKGNIYLEDARHYKNLVTAKEFEKHFKEVQEEKEREPS